MTIQVNDNWWKTIFDEIYLLTDARSVCDDNLTCQEVNFLENTLDWKKSDSILDLCGGQGRHALELSRRGFDRVTVLDYSGYLLACGKKRADHEKLNTIFVQGDARNTGLVEQSFQYIIVMASSFGYFMSENENKKILDETFRLLMPGGTFLLDLPNRDYVLKNFKAFSSHQINEEVIVHRERELGDDIIYCRERVMFENKGCVRDNTYCIRLYSPEKISSMLQTVSFSSINFINNFMSRDGKGDYGCMTNRIIVTAQKN